VGTHRDVEDPRWVPPTHVPVPQLSEKYGPVFTVYLGSRRVVVLSGHAAVREALVGNAEAFAGRGRLPTVEETFRGHGEGTLTPRRDSGWGVRRVGVVPWVLAMLVPGRGLPPDLMGAQHVV